MLWDLCQFPEAPHSRSQPPPSHTLRVYCLGVSVKFPGGC
jgi:hypothetical protein